MRADYQLDDQDLEANGHNVLADGAGDGEGDDDEVQSNADTEKRGPQNNNNNNESKLKDDVKDETDVNKQEFVIDDQVDKDKDNNEDGKDDDEEQEIQRHKFNVDGDTNGNDDVPQDSILNTVDSAEPEMPQILPTDQNDAP